MGGIWSKAVEHLMQNGRALRDAPLVFVAVLLLAFALSFWVNGLRFQGIIDAKNGTIETLNGQIAGLNGQIAGLNTQVANLGASVRDLDGRLAARPAMPPAIVAQRDPDGIYQFDTLVAKGRGGQIDKGAGGVFFPAVIGTGDFNGAAEMEYRELRLGECRWSSFGTEATMGVVSKRTYSPFTCRILGQRPSASASQ